MTAIAPQVARDGRPRFVGSAAGLVVHGDDGRDRIVDASSGLGEDWVTALAAVGAAVYVGTYRSGVARVDASGRVTRVASARWVSPGALLADAGGILAGTLGDGLAVSPAAGGFWTELTGLPDRQVTGLARDSGVLWIATRGGLARLGPR